MASTIFPKDKTVDFGGIEFTFTAEEAWQGTAYRWLDILVVHDGNAWRISDTGCRVPDRTARTFRLAAEAALQMREDVRER